MVDLVKAAREESMGDDLYDKLADEIERLLRITEDQQKNVEGMTKALGEIQLEMVKQMSVDDNS